MRNGGSTYSSWHSQKEEASVLHVHADQVGHKRAPCMLDESAASFPSIRLLLIVSCFQDRSAERKQRNQSDFQG